MRGEARNAAEQIDFSQPAINRACREFELILALEAARGAEVVLDVRSAGDRCIHRFVSAARSATPVLVCEVLLLLVVMQTVTHSRQRGACLLSDLSAWQALLVEDNDSGALDQRQRSVVAGVWRGERRWG